MNLILRRRPSNENCTIGELYLDTGQFLVYTLEDVVREIPGVPVKVWKIAGKSAIPQGKYRVTLTLSKRFARTLPLLNMVEGFDGIRIHPGNVAADTEGCLLPGMSVTPDNDSVLESKFAFNKLYAMIDAASIAREEVWIEIRNP